MGYIHGVANYGGITNFLIYSFIFSLFPLSMGGPMSLQQPHF